MTNVNDRCFLRKVKNLELNKKSLILQKILARKNLEKKFRKLNAEKFEKKSQKMRLFRAFLTRVRRCFLKEISR